MSESTSAAEFLRDLLQETAAAHGEFEKTELNGVYDEDWPTWYAAFMARTLEERGVELVDRTSGERYA
jgi:hypothetical protein